MTFKIYLNRYMDRKVLEANEPNSDFVSINKASQRTCFPALLLYDSYII